MPPANQPAATERFPFDVEFQKSLLRLVADDETFGLAAMEYLRSEYFESEVLGWMFGVMQTFQTTYGAIPSLHAVQQETRNLDPAIRQIYQVTVEQVQQASLRDEMWLREATLDYVKRNIFVRAFQKGRDLYNDGKTGEAYDLMMSQMDAVNRVRWEPLDASDFYDALPGRQAARIQHNPEQDAVPTGFPTLDAILRGGLHPGELGIWMAYAKIGKSNLLVTLGLEASRRGFRVLHIVLEGSRKLIEDRYDAAFVRESYTDVKAGRMSPDAYRLALQDYNFLRGNLWIESYVDKWDPTVLDIDATMRRLKRSSGWVPHLVVIDYADLMTGRDKKYYRSETESQRAVYRDTKRLAGRGYAIWTASQAQRPRNDARMEQEHILYSNSVADTYEKVRAGDFLGKCNQTPVEKQNNILRAYAEMYRDNVAGQMIYLDADYSRMCLTENAAAATLGWAQSQNLQQPNNGNGQHTAF